MKKETLSFWVGIILITLLIGLYLNSLQQSITSGFDTMREDLTTLSKDVVDLRQLLPQPKTTTVKVYLTVREITEKQKRRLDRTEYLSIYKNAEVRYYQLAAEADYITDTIACVYTYNAKLDEYFSTLAHKLYETMKPKSACNVNMFKSMLIAIATWESVLWPLAEARGSSAHGLFQVTKQTAKDAGISHDDVLSLRTTDDDANYGYLRWHFAGRAKHALDLYEVYAYHFNKLVMSKTGLTSNTTAYKRNPFDFNADGTLDMTDIKVALDTNCTIPVAATMAECEGRVIHDYVLASSGQGKKVQTALKLLNI